MSFFDWIFWFFLPRGVSYEYRRSRVDGTSDPDRLRDAWFWKVAGLVFWLDVAAVFAYCENNVGAAGPAVVVGAIAFFAFVVAWTLIPWGARTDDRWERRNPAVSRTARRDRGRGYRSGGSSR